MQSDLCEKLAVFCTVLFGLATASAGPASFALGGAAAILTLPAIMEKLRRTDPTSQAMMKRLERQIAANYRDWARNGGDITADQIPPMEAALAAVLPRLALDPHKVMEAGRDNSGLATIVLTEASKVAPGDFGSKIDPQQAINRRALHGLVVRTLAALDGDRAFEATMQPWFQREVFTRFDRLEAKIDRLALSAYQQAELEAAKARAEAELGSTLSLIDGFLQTILVRNVPPDQWPATLMRLAGDWKNAGRRIDALSASQNLLPELGELREQALEAYRQEDVDRVWSILSEIESKEAEAYERLLAHRSEIDAELDLRREGLIEAKRGKLAIALSAFRAEEVAHLLVEILDLETAETDRFTALRRLHQEWFVRGHEKSLNLDLGISMELARIAVGRAANRDERGAALNDLANALQALGRREAGTDSLEEAVGAYNAALQERTRGRVPLDWAETQNNLGNALLALGERETGTERLQQAVDAFNAALQEHTRNRVPLGWAATQNNLGSALATLGRREAGTERLQQAIDAHSAALEEHPRDRVPLDWATAQNNLGNALAILGERETGTERLEQAVDAYRAALEERTRDRAPLGWAAIQNNLGNALLALGQREAGTERLEQAVDAYNAALEERTRDRVPLDWAITQNNLGGALLRLGQHEAGTERLEQAVEAFRAALEERTRDRVPLGWAMTQNNLGIALKTIGQRETGTERLEQAVDAYSAAFEEYTRDRVPYQWAQTRENLATAFVSLFLKTNEQSRLRSALDAVDGALEVYQEAQAAYDIETAERLRAEIIDAMGEAAG